MMPMDFVGWIFRALLGGARAGANAVIPGGCFTVVILAPVFVVVGFLASFYYLGRATFSVLTWDSTAAKLAVFAPAILGLPLALFEDLNLVLGVFVTGFLALFRDLFVRYRAGQGPTGTV